MKKIENYLPFYIGQSFKTNYGITKMIGFVSPYVIFEMEGSEPSHYGDLSNPDFKDKIILRQISDMTDVEEIDIGNITNLHTVENLKKAWIHKTPFMIILHDTPELIMYLCSKGFDIFGLIEDGLAVDKNKIPKT